MSSRNVDKEVARERGKKAGAKSGNVRHVRAQQLLNELKASAIDFYLSGKIHKIKDLQDLLGVTYYKAQLLYNELARESILKVSVPSHEVLLRKRYYTLERNGEVLAITKYLKDIPYVAGVVYRLHLVESPDGEYVYTKNGLFPYTLDAGGVRFTLEAKYAVQEQIQGIHVLATIKLHEGKDARATTTCN